MKQAPDTRTPDYAEPVAYDTDGRPLYAHPQKAQEPQIVHMTRPLEPAKPELSEEVRRKHDDSAQRYPHINLSEGEYVLRAVKRHPIGLFFPMGLGIFMIALILALLINFSALTDTLGLSDVMNVSTIIIPVLLFVILIALGMYIVYYVYTSNEFYLTNESVVQQIQTSLFTRSEQTVSLANIEDASFVQSGILPQLLDYGSIRLSTEGDETTYRFNYVARPKDHIETLNNAVEAFKNGRPVSDN
ncbi:MAG: hypothetical protein JWN33_148 [Candidatus Saccharibacteria bacterium]|nr:hypothetical protein [Candidatus Saccharibacteria bacterium]